MRFARLVLVVAAAVAGLAAAARASIMPPPPPLVCAQKADVAFVGKVESVGKDSMRVVVGEVMKGAPERIVTVRPIHHPECCPRSDDEPAATPAYKAGDRIVVLATIEKDGLWTVGGTMSTPSIETDEQLAHAVAFQKEMIRIASLPDADARRAAMIVHLSSKDRAYVDAASYFQYEELKSPEQTRPHVAALLAALDAPSSVGRRTALYALHGVLPSDQIERVAKMTRAEDRDEGDAACHALARCDDQRAVAAIVAAAGRGHPWRQNVLGWSPRREAHERLRKLLRSGESESRKIAFVGYRLRFETFGATERDVDDLLSCIGGTGHAGEEIYALSDPMIAAKSVRMAEALVEIVRDEKSSPSVRAIAYRVLHEDATKNKMDDVVALLAKEEALLIRRLDGPGGDQQMHLHWLLGVIHTPACKASLERAMKRQDTPTSHGDAWRTLYDWKD